MKKIIFGSLLVALLFATFFYPIGWGIGIGVLFLLAHSYLVFARNPKAPYLKLAYGFSAVSIISALLIGWRATEAIQVVNFLFASATLILAGFFYKNVSLFSFRVFSFLFIPFVLLKEVAPSISLVKAARPTKKPSKEAYEKRIAVLRGIFIAIPVVLVLLALLSGADPIFRTLLGKLSFVPNAHFILTLIVFALCLIWGILVLPKKDADKEKPAGHKFMIEALIVTGSAAGLFAVFLLVQAHYLFSDVPELELSQLGINVQTYSEYVRQGFFQLLIAAGIAGSMIAYFLRFLHQKAIDAKYLSWGMLLLTIETELLLVSAGKRLWLYQEAHGMSEIRFLGIFILAWISLVLFILVVAILRKVTNKQLSLALGLVTIATIAGLNLTPYETLIASKYPPTVNHEVDYLYIVRMSPEITSSWPKVIEATEKSIDPLFAKTQLTSDEWRRVMDAQTTMMILQKKKNELEKKYGDRAFSLTKWQGYNYNEYQAYQFIKAREAELKKMDVLSEKMNKKSLTWRLNH